MVIYEGKLAGLSPAVVAEPKTKLMFPTSSTLTVWFSENTGVVQPAAKSQSWMLTACGQGGAAQGASVVATLLNGITREVSCACTAGTTKQAKAKNRSEERRVGK